MKKLLLIFLVLAMSIHATTYYVSPTGSDAAAGSLAAPFATVQHALSAGADIVYLRAGTYTQTLSLDTSFSGSGTRRLVCGYQSEKPVLSGGTTVTGWTLHDAGKNIYQATVGLGVHSRQFYVDGVRMPRCRNLAIGFTQNGNGFDCPAWLDTLHNINKVEILLAKNMSWVYQWCPIASVSGTHCIMQQPGWNNCTRPTGMGSDNTVCRVAALENSYTFLLTAGQWYFNDSTGILYYIPLAGQNMATDTCILATTENLINASHVANLEFRDIEFAYSTWLRPSSDTGFAEYFADGVMDSVTGTFTVPWMTFSAPNTFTTNFYQIQGNLKFFACSNILIDSCIIDHMGATGLQFGGACHACTTRYCKVTDISGSGISVGAINGTDTNNTNCTIDHDSVGVVGLELFGCVGIFSGFTKSLAITHNYVWNTPYTGISAGWGWGCVYWPSILNFSNNTIIAYNRIDSSVQVLLNGAAIYTVSADMGGKIHDNYVHNMVYYVNNVAIFSDCGTEYYRIYNNVLDSSTQNYPVSYGNGDQYDTVYNNYYNYATGYGGTGDATDSVAGNNVISGRAWPFAQLQIIKNSGVGGYPFFWRTSQNRYYRNKPYALSGQLASYFDSAAVILQKSTDTHIWTSASSISRTKNGSSVTFPDSLTVPSVIYLRYLTTPKIGGVDTSVIDSVCHSCWTF